MVRRPRTACCEGWWAHLGGFGLAGRRQKTLELLVPMYSSPVTRRQCRSLPVTSSLRPQAWPVIACARRVCTDPLDGATPGVLVESLPRTGCRWCAGGRSVLIAGASRAGPTITPEMGRRRQGLAKATLRGDGWPLALRCWLSRRPHLGWRERYSSGDGFAGSRSRR